jgi:hypothetical protein
MVFVGFHAAALGKDTTDGLVRLVGYLTDFVRKLVRFLMESSYRILGILFLAPTWWHAIWVG